MLRSVKSHATSLAIIGLGTALLAGAVLIARSLDVFTDMPERERALSASPDQEDRVSTASLSAGAERRGLGWTESGRGGSRGIGEGNADEAGARRRSDTAREAAARSRGLADLPPQQRARARTINVMFTELSRRRHHRRNRLGRQEQLEQEEEEEQWVSIRQYLTDFDEEPSEVRDMHDILGDPSNVVALDEAVFLMAWDVRSRAPRGSYLSVMQQGGDGKLAQIHRYFCAQRRLDVLAEICVPIASVFSSEGLPLAASYGEDGLPGTTEADDLDPSTFSAEARYVEANELLARLQAHFDGEGG